MIFSEVQFLNGNTPVYSHFFQSSTDSCWIDSDSCYIFIRLKKVYNQLLCLKDFEKYVLEKQTSYFLPCCNWLRCNCIPYPFVFGQGGFSLAPAAYFPTHIASFFKALLPVINRWFSYSHSIGNPILRPTCICIRYNGPLFFMIKFATTSVFSKHFSVWNWL